MSRDLQFWLPFLSEIMSFDSGITKLRIMDSLSVEENSKLVDKKYKTVVIKFKERDAVTPASVSLKAVNLMIMKACALHLYFWQFIPLK